MSESNHFEIVMQQKMDGFLVEPAPSDWQAIYDRLHPRNKRRIIWWWFPLIAALGAGTYWISMETGGVKQMSTVVSDNAVSKPISEASELIVTEEEKTTKADASENTETTSIKVTTPSNEPTPANNGQVKNDIGLISPPVRNEEKPSTTRRMAKQLDKKHTASIQQSPGLIPTRSSENDQSVRSSKEQLTLPPLSEKTEPQQLPANNQSLPSIENIAQVKPVQPGKISGDSTRVSSKIDLGKMIVSADPQVKETTTIPVKNNNRNWRLAAYLGTGPNNASEPIQFLGSAMSADLNSAPINNNSGSRTYSTTAEKGGWHFAGGIAAEKNLGKNWMFMTGLGINTSTWKVSIENYKDSLSFGSVTSTYKVSSQENKYRLWMAEVPLQFSNRIAGKKTGSLWWTIGINNQFRLKFTQQSVTDSLSGTSMADSRVMTSSTRFYQPQFRLGLMYNHNGKVHWQLQPLFQYTLTGVYASGGSDNTILTNLQLQYRLFLQGKNKGKKSSK